VEVKAILRYLRIAPRKTRDVVDLIRNKKAQDAQTILSFTVRKSAPAILKLLNSAIASATNTYKLNVEDLTVVRAFVDEGPRLKRSFPMSRGRAYPIEKRVSHITIILSDGKIEEKVEKTPEVKKTKTVKKEKKVKEVKEVKVKKTKTKK
jgi:large subunit ribosomal protein L22